MSYTKEPIIIDNPSKELLEVVKNLKERKRSQLEKLRNMKPEDFSCSFSITTKKGDEYRIMLIDADISMLAKEVRDIILENNLDISEIMIDRISGGESTAQEVLHTITGKVADLFAINVNLILYYSCDDMNPIPSMHLIARNKHQSIVDVIKDDVLEGWGK